MAESPLHVRALALVLVASLLGQTAGAVAQAAPPPQAPPPSAAPPPQTTYPAQPAPPPSSYQQQQGAPPAGNFQPAPSPLYPQQQQGYPPPQQAYPQQQYPQQQYPQQGYAQPGYQQPPGRWQPPRRARTRKGLMITGISILGGAYLLSVIVGGSLLDEEDEDEYDPEFRYQDDVAPWLFVPVAGPFIAMSQTPNDGGLWLLGLLQLVGTGLMIGGIVQYKNSKRAAEMEGFTHWKLPKNRELALDVATSPRFAGPRLKLSF